VERALALGTARIIHREDAAEAAALWANAKETQTGYEVDYRVRRADGVYRWQSWRIQPVHSGSELIGWTGVGIDTDDAKRLQLELSQANEQLAVANAVKDDFLALVSHELRTPLTTIAGLAEVLVRRHDVLSEQDRRESLQQLRQDSERLQAIIENLLVLARIDQDGVELEPVLVQRIASDVLAAAKAAHPARRIRLLSEDDAAPVLSQGTLLRLILENLVGNALKYSDPGSPIDLRLQSQDGGIAVSVLDRGWGITAEDRRRVFEPFFRAPDATRSRAPGVGLGLAVSQRLVALHGGTISVRNRRGGGTAFEFWLPLLDDPTGI
jgi:signal transduction histidine kinase